VFGVEPEVADDARQTLHSGAIQTLERAPDTIADGVRATAIGRRNFEVMVERRLVDDIVTVTEAEVEDTLVRAWLELKLAIEPTAALPLAAVMTGRVPADDGRPVGVVLSGGNAAPGVVARLLSTA
jgi:threonine dehydratase